LEAAGFYERAVQLDPGFAIAWARRSRTNAHRYFLNKSDTASTARRDAAKRALENQLRVGPEISEIHSTLIRAVTCSRLAYFVDIGGMTAAIGVIRVETVVWDGYPQHAVTVNVDAA
jgi:hypothetical protein